MIYFFCKKNALPVLLWIKWDKSVSKRLGCGQFCLRYFRQALTHLLLFQPSRRNCFSTYLSKNAKCRTCWSICQNWLSNCQKKVFKVYKNCHKKSIFLKVYCSICEYCKVFMFVGDVEFADCWDLDFRNCNLLKGGPPSIFPVVKCKI